MLGTHAAGRDLTVIEPRRGWGLPDLREVAGARELMFAFAVRDFRSRYRQTAGGFAWFVGYPLLSTGAFVLVFNRLAGLTTEGIPAVLYTYVGMLGWLLFSIILQTGTQSVMANRPLVAKVWFPRLALPLSACVSALMTLAINFVVMAALLGFYRVVPGVEVVTLPLWIAGLALLALGPTMAGAAMSVKYRDIAIVMPFALQLLMFLSPLAYGKEAIPSQGLLHWVYRVNPLSPLVEGLRWSVLDTTPPSAGQLLYAGGFALTGLLVGLVVFSRLERSFADVI